jgi:hypothetical protein
MPQTGSQAHLSHDRDLTTCLISGGRGGATVQVKSQSGAEVVLARLQSARKHRESKRVHQCNAYERSTDVLTLNLPGCSQTSSAGNLLVRGCRHACLPGRVAQFKHIAARV